MTSPTLAYCLVLAVLVLAVHDLRRKRGWLRGLIAGVLVGLAVSRPGREMLQPELRDKTRGSE